MPEQTPDARTAALDELGHLIGQHANWWDDDPAQAPAAIIDAGYWKVAEKPHGPNTAAHVQELTPEYRSYLRQNADHYGDPLISHLLDALAATEAKLAEEEAHSTAALADVAHLAAQLDRVKSELAEEKLNTDALIQRAIDADRNPEG